MSEGERRCFVLSPVLLFAGIGNVQSIDTASFAFDMQASQQRRSSRNYAAGFDPKDPLHRLR